MTRDVHQTVVCAHLDDIIVLQTDITCEATVEDELIDIDHRYQFTLAIDLDVTQRTQANNTTRTIERMIYCRQRAQRISSRYTNLTQNINLDRARLSQCDTNVRALEELAQSLSDFVLCRPNLQSADLNRSELWDIDITLRAHRQFQILLRTTIDIHHQYVARTQYIVLWRSDIHIGREGQVRIIENITTKNLIAGSATTT